MVAVADPYIAIFEPWQNLLVCSCQSAKVKACCGGRERGPSGATCPSDTGRGRRWRPRIRPDRVAGDKGDTGQTICGYLRWRGIGPVILGQQCEPWRSMRFEWGAYRERNRVARSQLAQAPSGDFHPVRETGGVRTCARHTRRYPALAPRWKTDPRKDDTAAGYTFNRNNAAGIATTEPV
jgi:hypothetical protein